MIATTGGLYRGETISALGWHHLGLAVLTETFRWAAFGLWGETTLGRHVQRITEAQVFLRGSGLDLALDRFGIELTGDEARGLFDAWVRRRKTPYAP